MTLRRFRSRAFSLLALLAVALQGLWPLLAQARPAPAVVPASLCTLDGAASREALAVRGDAPAKPGGPHGATHCALCITAGERAAPPPAATIALARATRTADDPVADACPHFDSAFRRPAQPRAPPAPG